MGALSVTLGVVAGAIIGSAITKKQSKKEITTLKERERENKEYIERLKEELKRNKPGDSEEYIPAEIAFSENIDKFIPLLRGVSKEKISNRDKWTEIIVSVNNGELTQMWKATNTRPDLWITYLQTFGLQTDYTDSFECIESYKDLYTTEDEKNLEIGKEYKVISPCWIYTNERNEKSVALKGIVKQLN